MKKYTFLTIILFVLSFNIFANTLEPAISVVCTAPERPVSEFSFDLYATGHPMGGVTRFTGMFEIKSELGCYRGRIVTLVPKNNKLNFRANMNCASEHEIILDVDTDRFSEGVPYSAVIAYRTKFPFGYGQWTQQTMTCIQQ